VFCSTKEQLWFPGDPKNSEKTGKNSFQQTPKDKNNKELVQR